MERVSGSPALFAYDRRTPALWVPEFEEIIKARSLFFLFCKHGGLCVSIVAPVEGYNAPFSPPFNYRIVYFFLFNFFAGGERNENGKKIKKGEKFVQ